MSAQLSTPSRDEEERAFLQQRMALFWKVIFLIALLPDTAQLLLKPELILQPWAALDRLATLSFGAMWLLFRSGSRSLRFLYVVEAIGLALVALTISLMGRFLVMDLAPQILTDIPGADPASPEVIRGVDVAVSTMVVLGGALSFCLRAALIPSPPLRSLLTTLLLGAPYVIVSLLLAPVSGEAPALRDAPLPAPQLFMHSMWWVVVALACAVVSHVVYGLRSQVREARRLGQYTLEGKLGEGGMGVVYRARHGMMRRPTAIKLLPPERTGESSLRRFEREVQLTARLTHPNTITIFDYGRTPDGLFYYAMELLEGASLESVVATAGRLPAERVLHVLHQAAGALAEAHGIALIHRDIKPANVMLCRQGGVHDVAKLVDFGLVKELESGGDAALTQADVVTGTPLYLAPEAISNPDQVGPRSDLYSVGAVAYFALVGTHVFGGRTVVEVCSHHLHTPPEPPSKRLGHAVPADLEALILDCLAKDPEDRPASAAELRRRVETCEAFGRWTSDDANAWWDQHAAATITDATEIEETSGTLTRHFERRRTDSR